MNSIEFLLSYPTFRYGKKSMLWYIAVCSMIGGISVSVTTGLGAAIVETAYGDNQVRLWIYALLSLPRLRLPFSLNTGSCIFYLHLLSSPSVRRSFASSNLVFLKHFAQWQKCITSMLPLHYSTQVCQICLGEFILLITLLFQLWVRCRSFLYLHY